MVAKHISRPAPQNAAASNGRNLHPCPAAAKAEADPPDTEFGPAILQAHLEALLAQIPFGRVPRQEVRATLSWLEELEDCASPEEAIARFVAAGGRAALGRAA